MSVDISGVTIDVDSPKHPELVPFVGDKIDVHAQDVLRVLRWMIQKASIGQDMFLVGYPGPHVRRIADLFCTITQREAEHVTLSRDTGEGDLKQRREITNSSVVHVDQAVVRAAKFGRVLIVDGVERAERNVLPLLNNLLENREMALEDNSFLMAPKRYDELSKSGVTVDDKSKRLIRVSPRFLVIAIGLPVPPYIGMPLDPPLRSRFAAYAVPHPFPEDSMKMLAKAAENLHPDLLRAILVGSSTLVEMGPHVPSSSTAQSKTFKTSTATLPHFPLSSLPNLARLVQTASNPHTPSQKKTNEGVVEWAFSGVFPHRLMVLDPGTVAAVNAVVARVTSETALLDQTKQPQFRVTAVHTNNHTTSHSEFPHYRVRIGVWEGTNTTSTEAAYHVEVSLLGGDAQPKPTEPSTLSPWLTASEAQAVSSVILDLAVGADSCLVGHRGVGKTTVAREVARLLGYNTRSVFCYKDMGVRDFLQRRSTDAHGNTTWEDSALLDAALNGHMAILDGIDRVTSQVLYAAIHQLVTERSCVLPDGRRLISPAHYAHLKASNTPLPPSVLVCHPRFRIIATAQPPTATDPYLSHHVLPLFVFREISSPSSAGDINAVLGLAGAGTGMPGFANTDVFDAQVGECLAKFDTAIREAERDEPLLKPLFLSTRQLRRIHDLLLATLHTSQQRQQAHPTHETIFFRWLPDAVRRSFSAYLRFLPPFLQALFNNLLEGAIVEVVGDPQPKTAKQRSRSRSPSPPRRLISVDDSGESDPDLKVELKDGMVCVGDVVCPVSHPEHPELVPHTLFYTMAHQTRTLQDMLRDFSPSSETSSRQALLLVGPQGVGKNKLADHMLELLGREREYMQLHRDTTVHTLTLAPTLNQGVVVWEDSPLVRACKNGRVLVVDEADKAPMEVTCVLKALVEDGELTLANGLRLVRNASPGSTTDESVIHVHPRFQMIVLANRPGFPFLGNDFYRECGDVFACHVVDNPDADSELSMLQQYAPNVPPHTLRRLVNLFASLRLLAQEGILSYPYSTRELVHIAKHLQRYPDDTVEQACGNVFAFDSHDTEARRVLAEEMSRVGLNAALAWETALALPKDQSGPQDPASQDKHPFTTKLRFTLRKTGKVPDATMPKHGKIDEQNKPHSGGNTWQGGTGGRDTAGLGGKGGPYRVDAGHDVHMLSDEEKASGVSDEAKKAAREIARQAYLERLREIDMNTHDAGEYMSVVGKVQAEITQLRMVLESHEAKESDRVWLKRQTHGELDENLLVDGITGTQAVYKRRGEQRDRGGFRPLHPKRVLFVMDVSASMFTMNHQDRRLDRLLQTTAMVFESFEGFDHKYQWSLVGHSGDTERLDLVDFGTPPKTPKERLQVLKRMVAHTQHCFSGDHTVEAADAAIKALGKDTTPADERFVFLVSDANLARYGIRPEELGRVLTQDRNVHAHVLFISSVFDSAERLQAGLPAGKAHVCLNTADLPRTLKQIFLSTMLRSNL